MLRIIYVEGSDIEQIRADLRDLGCSTEWDKDHRLISVNVPPEASISHVRTFLDTGLERGISDYEEAIVRE